MSKIFNLVRTDSTMINPQADNDLHNINYPVGEVIMSPRKRYSIISTLNNEIKQNVKLIQPIQQKTYKLINL